MSGAKEFKAQFDKIDREERSARQDFDDQRARVRKQLGTELRAVRIATGAAAVHVARNVNLHLERYMEIEDGISFDDRLALRALEFLEGLPKTGGAA